MSLTPYLAAAGLILGLLLAWVTVQQWARRFAARHPEFGPHRERAGCGLACPCDADEPCPNGRRKPEGGNRMTET